MAKDHNIWRTIVYVFIGIVLVAIALRLLGFILNLTLHLAGIFLSLVFVVGLLYAIYVIFRGAFTSK